jgi:hypothetical protein
MPSQSTNKLELVNGQPSVTRLWNGRYRLEFFCKVKSGNEGWYSDKISQILPAFTSAQDDSLDGNWQAPSGSAYSDMRLVEASIPYIAPLESHFVTLIYETLTDAWVEDKAETVDYELNGLKVIERTKVALPNTAYNNVVGTSTITSDGKTLYLGGYEIEETDAKWELKETWMEAGIVSRSEVDVDGGSSIQRVTTYLASEGTPTGLVTRRDVGSYEGLSTYTVTEMLSPDGTSIISSDPNLISQKASISNFTIPGLVRVRQSERTRSSSSRDSKMVNYTFDLIPPVNSPCKTTVYEFLQTEKDIQSSDYTYGGSQGLWAPRSWARSRVSGISGNKPFSVAKSYSGYRTPGFISELTKQTVRSNSLVDGDGVSVLRVYMDGYKMSNEIPATMELSGGPEDPVGGTYVVDVTIEPDFTDANDVKYYKKYITVMEVEGERIDDALSGDAVQNRLGGYTTTDEGNGNYSITLDDTLAASDDGFYTGARLVVYPRDKDSRNAFKEPEVFWVYDYDGVNNKILINGQIDSGNAVGMYSGSGDLSNNANYENARINIVKYGIHGTVTRDPSNSNWWDGTSARIWHDCDVLEDDDDLSYNGWTMTMTSGGGTSYTITASGSGYFGSNAAFTNVVEGDTFVLTPPYSFT